MTSIKLKTLHSNHGAMYLESNSATVVVASEDVGVEEATQTVTAIADEADINKMVEHLTSATMTATVEAVITKMVIKEIGTATVTMLEATMAASKDRQATHQGEETAHEGTATVWTAIEVVDAVVVVSSEATHEEHLARIMDHDQKYNKCKTKRIVRSITT